MKKPKPEVTYTAKTIVWFEIKGTFVQHGSTLSDTENITGRFMKWLCNQTFFPARMQMTGGGCWYGAFWPEDADTVKKWLLENGAKEIA